MADLAQTLIRTVARAFYGTEHILVIDALMIHSTLPDSDLALLLNTQTKPLRKTCGRLREDGLISVQPRQERRTDGSSSFYGTSSQPGKERLTTRDWYYINFHRAIDSIKFRMNKLNKFIESQGAPSTEKTDRKCITKGCGGAYTDLDVIENFDFTTGEFLCPRCSQPLQAVEEEERASENENMKRLNQDLAGLLKIMQQIDASQVPENDFETALSKQKAVVRQDGHPASRTEIVDTPNGNIKGTKGLEIKPEKTIVQLQDDEDVKRENAAAEARERKEKEAKQNALPEWISKSTITGETTTVGAKEEKQRQEREAHSGNLKDEESEDKKPNAGDEDVMAAYWEELKRAQEQEAQQQKEEDEDDEDDDEDEFEDVDVSGGGNTPLNGAATSTGVNTPAHAESSNATDDEPESKRLRLDGRTNASLPDRNRAAEDTPAASDADDDELEFENV